MNTNDRDPLDLVAEEFSLRCRQGDVPAVDEYVEKYPQYADELRELLPSVAMMEKLKRAKKPNATMPQPVLPERIGDFRIVREIGRGGMGVVYEAEQKSLGRRVALKLLPQQFLVQPQRLERFRREACAAAQLHHTNIVPVFGVGEDAGMHYYVMQLIEGYGLEALLASRRTKNSQQDTVRAKQHSTVSPKGKKKGTASFEKKVIVSLPPSLAGDPEDNKPTASYPFVPHKEAVQAPPVIVAPPKLKAPTQIKNLSDGDLQKYYREIVGIGKQIALALQYAHDNGTLHRDVKPANVMIDHHGTAWLTDFGLAKLTEENDLTQTGDLIGTLHYLAPECLNHGKVDGRSDLYSLGLTLYEALTLSPPYTETQPARLLRQISETSPVRPREIAPSIPKDLETIILKATAKEPHRRYRSAGEFAVDLSNFLEGQPILARRASSLERVWRWCRRNRAISGLIATVAASLVFAACVGWVGYVSTTTALGRESLRRDEAEKATRRAEDNVALSLTAFEEIFQQLASAADSSAAFDQNGRPGQPDGRGPGHEGGPRPGQERPFGGPEFGGERRPPRPFDGPPGQRGFLGGPPGREGGPPPKDGNGPPNKKKDREALAADKGELLNSILSFYDKFAANNPTNPSLQSKVAKAYQHAGDIYRHVDNAKALSAYLSSIQILKTLEAEGANEKNRSLLTHASLAITSLDDDDDNVQLRLSHARKALAESEKLAQEFPQNPEYAGMKCQSYMELAAIETDQGELKKARANFDRSSELSKKANDLKYYQHPRFFEIGWDLAQELANKNQWTEASEVLKARGSVLERELEFAKRYRSPKAIKPERTETWLVENYQQLSKVYSQLKNDNLATEAQEKATRFQMGPPRQQSPPPRPPRRD